MSARTAVLLGILWALSLVWVYQFAQANTRNECEAAKVKPLAQAIDQHNGRAAKGHAADKKAAVCEDRRQAFFRGIQSEEKTHAKSDPLPAVCVLDVDRLRRWTAANAGATTVPASTPGGDPGPAAGAGERGDGGSVREPPGGDALVLALARSLSGPGGLAAQHGGAAE